MHSWSPECAQWCAIRLRRFLFCDMSLLQNYKGPSRRHRVVQSLFTPMVAMGINSFMLDNLLMPFIRNLFERERPLEKGSHTQLATRMRPMVCNSPALFPVLRHVFVSELQKTLKSPSCGASLRKGQ